MPFMQGLQAAGRRLQDERVSILDGTLPSPELGPHAPPPAAKAALPATSAAILPISTGHHCGKGCVAGYYWFSQRIQGPVISHEESLQNSSCGVLNVSQGDILTCMGLVCRERHWKHFWLCSSGNSSLLLLPALSPKAYMQRCASVRLLWRHI